MPLSEQEQRLLDEMERSLYHSDGEFVASMKRTRIGVNYTAVVAGILIAIAGTTILVAGVALHAWIVGILGFIAMFAGVVLAAGRPGAVTTARSGKPRTAFMARMAARWDRRQRS